MIDNFVYVTFASAAMILVGELLYDLGIQFRLVSIVLQSMGTMCLVFLLPIIYLFISNDAGYTKAQWGIRRVIFHGLSWLFYALCIFVSICVGMEWWTVISQRSIGSGALVVGFLALISSVLLISSLHEIEAATVMITRRFNSIRLFFTMNVMLVIVASVLAILAEITLVNRKNKPLAVFEASLSAALFILVLFNTHGLGGRLMHNSNDCLSPNGSQMSIKSPWNFFQPFVGGVKFVILQIASWLLFGISLLLGFLFILSTFTIGMEIFLGVEAVAGLCCIISEVLMIVSIHVYEKKDNAIETAKKKEAAGSASVTASSVSGSTVGVADIKTTSEEGAKKCPLLKESLSTTVQQLHALVITVLVTNMHYLPFLGIVPVFFTAGQGVNDTLTHWFAACVSIGVYTLAFNFFKARQFSKRQPSIQSEKLFTTSAVNGVTNVSTKDSPSSLPVVPEPLTGSTDKGGEPKVLLEKKSQEEDEDSVDGDKSKSLRSRSKVNGRSKGRHSGSGRMSESSTPSVTRPKPSTKSEVGDDFSTKYNVILLIVTCLPFASTVYLGYHGSNFLGPWMVVSVCHFLYVGYTYRGAPEITGCREIQVVHKDGPIVRYIGETVRRYFNGSIIKECNLDPKGLYVLGFHPHGIIPVTLFWLRCSAEWETLFPGVTFSPLTASVMHLVPLMRDLLQWMGGREVSRESFRHALKGGRSCLVVPGGQAEMLQSQSDDNDIRVVTKHSGFIRMALQEGAHLVPILSFGEVDIMDNVRFPILQQWFLKTVGMVFPHQPYGLYYLPIPRPLKITVVVGRPIPITQCAAPSDALVKKTMDIYMKALLAMFDKHKVAVGERPERRLVLVESDGKPYIFNDKSSHTSKMKST